MKPGRWAGLLLIAAVAARADVLEPFRWRAPLLAAWTNGGVYVADIPPLVFAGSEGFPGDLRIYDENGREWPFYVVTREPSAGEEKRLDLALEPVDPAEQKPGIQSLSGDVGYRRLPLRQLRLAFPALDRECLIKVYGRYSLTNQWRWMADHRAMAGLEHTVIGLRQNDFRYLKVDLYRYEHPPMEILSAEVFPEPAQLVVEADYGQQPFLYFGAVQHPLPHYELARRRGPGVPASASPMKFGKPAGNPARMTAMVWRYVRTLGLFVAAALAGLGLLIAIRVWRRRIA